jgi:hypothetical protein
MKYSHYSYLPFGAFEPILGKIKLYGGGGNPVSAISDFVSNAVSDVGNAISSSVSNVAQTVGDLGNQIDQAVNDNVPGGWALPVAVTAAVVAPEILPELIDAAPVAESAPAIESAPSITDIGLTGNEATDLSYFNANPTDTSYLNDYAPTDTGTAQIGSGTSLSPDAANNKLSQFYNVANPEVQANTGTVSNLVGGGANANLASLDALANNPLLPISNAGIGGAELGATGSIIGSGEGLGTQTLSDTLAPTGLNGVTVNDLQTQPTTIANPSVTASDVVDAAKTAKNIANLLKATNASQQQISNTQQNLAKSQALSNLLRGTQAQAVEAPTPYKAPNFFTFTPDQPIQNNLASLLRNNNYGY